MTKKSDHEDSVIIIFYRHLWKPVITYKLTQNMQLQINKQRQETDISDN